MGDYQTQVLVFSGGIIFMLMLLFVWALCDVASRADDEMERQAFERKQRALQMMKDQARSRRDHPASCECHRDDKGEAS